MSIYCCTPLSARLIICTLEPQIKGSPNHGRAEIPACTICAFSLSLRSSFLCQTFPLCLILGVSRSFEKVSFFSLQRVSFGPQPPDIRVSRYPFSLQKGPRDEVWTVSAFEILLASVKVSVLAASFTCLVSPPAAEFPFSLLSPHPQRDSCDSS